MAAKKQKRKIFWRQCIGLMLFTLLGALCGLLAGRYLAAVSAMGLPLGQYLLLLGMLCLGIYAAFLLQIIIHEAGHLAGGLCSGYRYCSFRIGSFMWIREDGRLRCKRLSIAGTGGQCLMCPPDMVAGKIPFTLYNLGGALANMLAGLVFLCVYQLLPRTAHLSFFLLLSGAIGIALALINGIPLRLGAVNNDGHNALSLGKSPDALRSFWVQIKVNEQVAQGVRLKDMPAEWFALPTEAGMQNGMTAALAVFAANRLMDGHAFGEAAELIERLLKMDSAIVGLHRGLLACDLIFCELIAKNRGEKPAPLLDGWQKKFMKSMKNFPTVLRTEHAYALLAENDAQKAGQIKARFEKQALSYPYPSDIESERELMQIAEQAAQGA